jgi:hypothetical protein
VDKWPCYPLTIDYTDKDFEALRAKLIAFVKSVFPDWSDFSVASFGNILLEMCAFIDDVVTFYLDNHARESRLVTATQRENVTSHLTRLRSKKEKTLAIMGDWKDKGKKLDTTSFEALN